MNILDIAIAKKLAGGGGGSGTDNYNDLSNLPKINDTTLSGNKSSSALGLQSEINSDSKLASDLVDDTNQDNKFVTSTEKSTWNGKQNAIDADHKINADYVDDSTSTNKFVTASDKETWNAKQSAIDSSHKLSSDLVDDTNHTNKFVTSTEKQTWNAKQNAIDADHKLSSSLVSFTNAEAAALASGIDSSKVGQISTNQTNILYTLGKTGKNILSFDINALKALNTDGTWNNNTYTYADVIYTINSDNSISVQTNSTISESSHFRLPVPVMTPDKRYKICTCIDNYSSEASYNYTIVYQYTRGGAIAYVSDTGTGGAFEYLKTDTGILVYLLIGEHPVSISTPVVFKPMICTEEDWNVSPDYQPYKGLPNVDLTQLEQEDRNALVPVIDKGAKNYFNPDNVVDLYSMTASANGYAYQSSDTDSRTYFALSVDAYYNSTPIGNLGTKAITQNGIASIEFTKLSTFNRLKIGHSGVVKTIAIFVNVPNLEDNKKYVVAINVAAYNPSVSLAWNSTMICDAAEFTVSQGFSEYALPNSDLTQMVSDLQKKAVKVYSYHVNPNESDPEDAVTYLDDAAGLTPAKMGASSFSYGSWANAWFLPKPCMLKSDGTVAYYLDPNDYSKKTDGTASDIADLTFDGNVMLEFPKIWVKRVNDGNGARTVSIAPVNVDGTYKCWSNINAEDKEVDHFYLPAYNGTIDNNAKMRSMSDVTLSGTAPQTSPYAYAPNYTRAQEVTAATANNPTGKNMWYTETWADFCLIYDLLYLMGKSLDVQRTFGQGLSSGAETAMRAYVTGTHNSKGLFYGDISGTSTAVKVLGMENLWGCRWHGVAGLINDNGTLKVKMTYGVADGSTTVGYNTTGSGYLTYGSTYGTNGFVKKMQADNTMGYKIIETAGTDATYYCDYYYTNNGISAYAFLGGSSGSGAHCGFYVYLADGAASASWVIGGSLSCRP